MIKVTCAQYLMVDVVVNDLAWAGNYTSIDYSQFNPFNSPEYFHPFRLLSDDFNNSTCVTEVSGCPLSRHTRSVSKGPLLVLARRRNGIPARPQNRRPCRCVDAVFMGVGAGVELFQYVDPNPGE